jgi:hypothetical protein
MPMKKALSVQDQTETVQPISFMTIALQNLLRLQTIEFEELPGKHAKAQSAELRGQIPTAILERYDRLRLRDRKAIAVVLNSACTACHMRQPIGKMAALMRGQDIQVCDSCGRYLLLSAPVDAQAVELLSAAQSSERRISSARMAR